LLQRTTPPADAWVLNNLYAPSGTGLAHVATVTSGAGTLLLMAILTAGVVRVWRHHRSEAASLLGRTALFLALCGSLLGLQGLIGRAGPPQQPEAGTYPSGHAIIVTAVLLASIILYARIGSPWLRVVTATGSALVLLVCASRVVLAEHWLIDVAAGIVGTGGVAMLAGALLRIGPGSRPGQPRTG
jgi:undecaprenyl-diphosphatase